MDALDPSAQAAAAPVSGLAPVAVEVAAPAPVVAETIAPAAVAVEPPVAAPVETPAEPVVEPVVEPVAPVEPVEPSKPDEAEKAPEHPKSLLAKFDEERAAKEAADKAKTPDAKPGEESAKPVEAEKPVEPAQDAPLIFELPAQLKAAPEQIEEFSNLLRSTKTGDLKESGQKLLDMHAKALDDYAKAYAKQASDHQWKVWNDMIAAKDKEVLADDRIGGAGHETAMAAIARMRDLLVPEAERGPFTEFLNTTGAGSWPVFLRMMHRAAEFFDEPPLPAPGGKPPRDAHLSQTNGRFGLLHDHPSSQMKKD